jgi:hypothetical protein
MSRRHLIKALGPRSLESAEQELVQARTSVLRWWWEYLRLSRNYWMVCKTSRFGSTRTLDADLAEVYAAFGDVWETSFDDWWYERGYEGFRELKGRPKVKQIPRQRLDRNQHRYKEDHVWVDIPLKLSRAAITRQISEILALPENAEHRVDNRMSTSNAKFKVNPIRYSLHSLAIAHDVHCLHRELIAKPERLKKPGDKSSQREEYQRRADMYRIGRLLKLSSASTIPTDDISERKARLNVMRATVGRYLARSNVLIANVEIGKFPAFSKLPPRPNRFSSFQLERHQELEEQWWSQELFSTVSGSRVLDARRVHYDEYSS